MAIEINEEVPDWFREMIVLSKSIERMLDDQKLTKSSDNKVDTVAKKERPKSTVKIKIFE